MQRITLSAAATMLASPAFAAGDKPFFSLGNTDFVVTLGFLVFIGILIYYKVPTLLVGMLDKRAERIRQQIHEAEELREEAQRQLAEAKRTQREAKRDAEEIVEHARTEAQRLRDRAEQDIKEQMERRERLTMQHIEQTKREAMEEVRARIALADRGQPAATEISADDPHARRRVLRSVSGLATAAGSAVLPASIRRLPTM